MQNSSSHLTGSAELIPWDQLSTEHQTRLRIQYGQYLDSLPPTCSMETKIERFRHWLQEQGICYEG
jgi:hypothetical protein